VGICTWLDVLHLNLIFPAPQVEMDVQLVKSFRQDTDGRPCDSSLAYTAYGPLGQLVISRPSPKMAVRRSLRGVSDAGGRERQVSSPLCGPELSITPPRSGDETPSTPDQNLLLRTPFLIIQPSLRLEEMPKNKNKKYLFSCFRFPR
jgi:hypothetical protein